MFGLNDNTTQSNDDPAMLDNVKQLASEPAESIVPAATPMQQQLNDTTTSTTPTTDTPVSTPVASTPLQGFTMDAPTVPQSSTTTDNQTDSSTDSQTSTSSDASDVSNVAQPDPTFTPVADDTTSTADDTTAPDPNHLAGLKQEALAHLEPLTEHLDGSPEEVFKTTMMMIQANDNHTLLEKALDAAKKIEDDKARAQAMLDIINEINYFAQSTQTN